MFTRSIRNNVLIGWVDGLDIYFTRACPYKKNDQVTIESKNNHLVRRYGYYHRYHAPTQEAELAAAKATLKPLATQHRISEIQQELTRLPARKTTHLEQQLTWKAPRPHSPENQSQLAQATRGNYVR